MIKTTGSSGAEAFLKVLTAMGVECIFASPGSEWSPVWEQLSHLAEQGKKAPSYLSLRHEEVAVAMAGGYAKVSGKLPAVLLHTTAGSLHGAMALRGAHHERLSMVVFAGESTTFGETAIDPGPQWLRHLADIGGPARMVESSVKWSTQVLSHTLFPSMVQRACQLATASPRGPVFLALPMEVLFDTMTNDAPGATFPETAPADPRHLDELAGLLVKAKNPIIVTESSGRTVTAVERLVSVAELLGAPVVETRSTAYLNFPRYHPLHGGFDPAEYLEEADLILLLSVVAPWHPASLQPQEGARVVLLDESPLRPELPHWNYSVDLCLDGEVDASLELLGYALKKRIKRQKNDSTERATGWHQLFRNRKQTWESEALALGDQEPLDTRWLVYELNQMLPHDAIIVEETITHRLAIHQYVDSVTPGSFFAGCTGGLGTGLGTALGAKTAAPDRPVVALIGDGSFNYNPVLAAFGCAQEYQMPILVILFNNQGYLTMKEDLRRYYPEGWAVKTDTYVGTSIGPDPDYPALARAFGGYGEKVEDPAEVRSALERGLEAIKSGQLALLDFQLQSVNM
jgi:acetolactate synthase-1/2/3 large subunit